MTQCYRVTLKRLRNGSNDSKAVSSYTKKCVVSARCAVGVAMRACPNRTPVFLLLRSRSNGYATLQKDVDSNTPIALGDDTIPRRTRRKSGYIWNDGKHTFFGTPPPPGAFRQWCESGRECVVYTCFGLESAPRLGVHSPTEQFLSEKYPLFSHS